ncbi:MAG: hypothetical protein K2M47_07240 [Clostridiales bacterium]|nr:hypothetical protein [Clostridiales bacterium]
MADNKKINESRDELAAEIERLETTSSAAIKPTLPKVYLQEKSYTAPDDATLRKSAESELADYRLDGEKSIRQKSEAEAEELNAKRDAYVDAKRNTEAELERQYEAAARAIDNDAVRRGLARSSIASVERGALEREYLNQTAQVAREYAGSIAKLESDIASVDKKLQDALNDFNLTYAAKLNKRLSELKAEREQKMQDVIEYNNEIKRQQASMDNDRLKTESSLYSAALSQEQQANSLGGASSQRRDDTYKAVYERMDAFLGSLDPQQALIEIRNHSMYRQHLSNYYYNRLYDKYGRGNNE